jgi:RND family efflux transporter MFP subunit
LQGEIQAVQLELDQMEKKRGLLHELADKGFITKATFEDNELNYLKTKIKLEQSKVALDTAQRNSKPVLEAIQTGVERYKANVHRAEQVIANARSDLNDAELRAPQAGLVVYAQISSSSPERIYEGLVTFRRRTLLYLPDVSAMVMDTEINEIDVREIKKGSPVNITVEAYPDAIFNGKVLRIGSLAKRKREASGAMSRIKVFDVTVSVEEKDLRLKPGLTAAANFIVDQLQDVVAIPVGAVHSDKGGDFVLLSNNGKVDKRRVLLGPSNEDSVVVTKGLIPGDRISLSPLPSGS